MSALPASLPYVDVAPLVFLVKVQQHHMKNNNYLIVDPTTHQALVVDPAWEHERIEAALTQARATLSGILITHTHFDHIHLARPLAERHHCPIWMSKQEIEASGFSAPQLIAIDETPWSVGALRIEPILTPGHTPGCVCYRVGDHLFTGDVLFAEGCGICPDLAAAYAMHESLEKLKRCIAPQVHVYPGHTYIREPGQRFADLLKYNMYLQFADRDSFAAYRLRRGQDANKLFAFR